MNFFRSIGKWIKKHILVTIIFILVIICGVVFITITSNNKQNDTKDLDTVKNGQYKCEFMYDGKSLDNEETIRSFMQKISSYTGTSFDDENVSEFKKNYKETMEIYHLEVNDNIIDLYIKDDENEYKFFEYNISNNEFSYNHDEMNEKQLNMQNTILNNTIKVKLSKNEISLNNFGVMFIYPTIINNHIKNGETTDNINIDYDKYTGLGDLVCKYSS